MELKVALIAIAVIVIAISLIVARWRFARSRPLPSPPAVPASPRAAPVPKPAPPAPQERSNALDERLRRRDRQAVEALQGRECIYQEKAFVCDVNVVRALASDTGVTLKLEVVPSPGFARQEGTFSVTATWEVFSVSRTHVYAAYVGWLVVTQADLVEEIKAQAAKVAEEMPLGLWINRRLFRSAKTPDPSLPE